MSILMISGVTATSCIGRGLEQTLAALHGRRGGLAPCVFRDMVVDTWVGEVAGVDDEKMDADLRDFNCRNNRLAQLALSQDGFTDAVEVAVGRWGRRRVGVFLGTSTAGMLRTEWAFRHRDAVNGQLPAEFVYAGTHSPYSLTEFVRRKLGLAGPAVAVSSACSSSAKVFASAQRMIDCGLIDAAVVGGVDSLCATTLYGFESLGLLAKEPCRPFNGDRAGISIGEAAAYMLVERVTGPQDREAVWLLGVGESSDAYHMSSPHPEGLGARLAMERALVSAGLGPEHIDYINLHGTGTVANDAAEAIAIANVFGTATPCSSTKGATGHTLGAAGALEAAICVLSIQNGFMPSGPYTGPRDHAMEINYISQNRGGAISTVLSNSFGFGGSNCSLIFGRPI